MTTVDLQKGATKYLKLSSAEAMKVTSEWNLTHFQIAEKLYQEGYISYPRTETAHFADNFDLHTLISTQHSHHIWGHYAVSLSEGRFEKPRKGKGDDQSHPPIHPIKSGQHLQGREAQIYEFVSRHFLACCSRNAQVELFLGQVADF